MVEIRKIRTFNCSTVGQEMAFTQVQNSHPGPGTGTDGRDVNAVLQLSLDE